MEKLRLSFTGSSINNERGACAAEMSFTHEPPQVHGRLSVCVPCTQMLDIQLLNIALTLSLA